MEASGCRSPLWPSSNRHYQIILVPSGGPYDPGILSVGLFMNIILQQLVHPASPHFTRNALCDRLLGPCRSPIRVQLGGITRKGCLSHPH